MRANDWAARFNEAGADVAGLLRQFVDEASRTGEARGGLVPAVAGAVREQREKWRAVCRLCPALTPRMFEDALALLAPELARAEADYARRPGRRTRADRGG